MLSIFLIAILTDSDFMFLLIMTSFVGFKNRLPVFTVFSAIRIQEEYILISKTGEKHEKLSVSYQISSRYRLFENGNHSLLFFDFLFDFHSLDYLFDFFLMHI